MLATNHAMTGIALGATLPIQYAIPIALASHFALDALPHYGAHDNTALKSRKHYYIVHFDTLVALTLALIAVWSGFWILFLVGLAAYLPDSQWVIQYFRNGKSLHVESENRLGKFHERIQHEYRWGLGVELPVALILGIMTIQIFTSY